MKDISKGINRRTFLRKSASTTALLGLTSAAVERFQDAFAAQNQPSAFAYDIERFGKTDPKLIRYEEVTRFPSSCPEPRRIAIGPDERLFVAGRNGVAILSPTGQRVRNIEVAGGVRCVAAAKDGVIYAGLRDHVEVFDSNGRQIASWAPPGKKTWLTGMAVTSDALFVADAGARAILEYDKSGKAVRRIGEKSKDRNIPGLIVPSPYLDVDVGNDGLLRVNNPGRHCIETYTAAGDLELSWGKPSAAVDGFCGCCNPIAIAVLPDGRCITCEKGLPRVKIFSAQGAFECVVAGPESFPDNAKAGSAHSASDGTMGGLDVTADAQGRAYVLDRVTGEIRVMKLKDNGPGKI